jgi:hypothetical protein
MRLIPWRGGVSGECRIFIGKLKVRSNLEVLGRDERIILKWMFKNRIGLGLD